MGDVLLVFQRAFGHLPCPGGAWWNKLHWVSWLLLTCVLAFIFKMLMMELNTVKRHRVFLHYTLMISVSMRLAIFSFLLAVTAVFCSAQDKPLPPAADDSPSAQEELFAAAPPKTEMSSKEIVKSQHHMAWVEKQGNLRMVFVDGKQQGGHYNEVTHLEFSPDEAHFAFATRSTTNWWLVYDGKDQPEQYYSIQGMQWRPGSNTLAYTACSEKKKCRFYEDGKASGPDYEGIYSLKYSRDGSHFAFMAYRNKAWYAVLDGKEIGPGMDRIDDRHWGFSRTGHFYVAACHGCRGLPRGHYVHEHWTYVVDGTAGPPFEVISPIKFSPDDKHYTYAGTVVKFGWKQKPVSSVMLDGVEQSTHDGQKFLGQHIRTGVLDYYAHFHGLSNPLFDPGGKLVYAARRPAGDVAVFVGGEPGPGYNEIISPLIFSPDAQHFAFVAQQGDTLVEVHDNHPGITFPMERRRSCYVAWIYVTNEPRHHLVYELVCGGSRFQHEYTSQALRRVVIDGQPGPEYDVDGLYGFRYTEDWKHYGYEIHGVEGNHVRFNIDGKETKVYDDVVTGSLIFPSPGEASFVAREGETLVHVKWPIQ